jgi:HSP20 family protein
LRPFGGKAPMAPEDLRRWMWMEACAVLERADRMQRQFFEPNLSEADGVNWVPPVDILETDREIWVISALPGVEPDDLQVGLQADTLVIAGRRRLPAPVRAATIHRLEIPHGKFERRLRIAATNLRIGRSELVNGCLILSLIKRF